MSSLSLVAGTIVATRVVVLGFVFTHVGVVTDRRGDDGERTVVSLSRRWGRAVHETLTSFADGKHWWVVGYPGSLAPRDVVDRAMTDVSRGRRWSVFSNCEHAVRRWHGVAEASPQLRSAISASGGLAAFLLLISRLR